MDDVVVVWVAGEEDKRALVLDEASPYFTTSHSVGHSSVLVRAGGLGKVDVAEVRELVQDALLARASVRGRAGGWRRRNGPTHRATRSDTTARSRARACAWSTAPDT